MSDERGGRQDPDHERVTQQELDAFVLLGQQLAAQMAEANFRVITCRPGWTMADVEMETEQAIERMEIASRDLLMAKGANPDSENWHAIWTAMESCYRQMMMDLLRVSGLRVGAKLQ